MASASPICDYQSWGVSLSLQLVVVRTTSWREGVLLGRPRVLPDRSPFTPVSTLYLNGASNREAWGDLFFRRIFFWFFGFLDLKYT
jgi:hypothetical protein